MSAKIDGASKDEPSLVSLYRELTGASESEARNVFMYLPSPKRLSDEQTQLEAPGDGSLQGERAA